MQNISRRFHQNGTISRLDWLALSEMSIGISIKFLCHIEKLPHEGTFQWLSSKRGQIGPGIIEI